MIISPMIILELNKKHNIIENLSEREMHPEGLGFDIRIGEVFSISGEGFLGVTDRKSPNESKIADIKKDKGIILFPKAYVLVKTIERFNIPAEKIEVNGEKMLLMPHVFPRSTLQRAGILLIATKTDPGYNGELTFALSNISRCRFKLELGARIANIVFYGAIGELSREYSGQWKDGRVAAVKKEKMN